MFKKEVKKIQKKIEDYLENIRECDESEAIEEFFDDWLIPGIEQICDDFIANVEG